jgi:hypothetical protein
MPRNPNATSPNAKTAGAIMMFASCNPSVLTPYAMAINATILAPSQYALKLPATNPDRMLSDGPPSLEDVTTSRTWVDSTDVKILTSSGMIAPAKVPHVITVESCHHRSARPPSSGISHDEATNVRITETTDVSQTRRVSGVSKFIDVALPKLALAQASLSR